MNLSNFPIEALSKEALISLIKAYDDKSVGINKQNATIEKLNSEVEELKKLYRDDGLKIKELEAETKQLKEAKSKHDITDDSDEIKTRLSELEEENKNLKRKLKKSVLNKELEAEKAKNKLLMEQVKELTKKTNDNDYEEEYYSDSEDEDSNPFLIE